jgi:hypothetical protein
MATWSELSAALTARRGASILAEDGDELIQIQYIGSAASATVTVASDGNITFKHGAVGSEANDVSIGGIADSGATLDVSNAANDTFGECVDLINGSPNWRARLTGALRADSANDTLVAVSETTLNAAGNFAIKLKGDTSVRFALNKYLGRINLAQVNGEILDDASTVAKLYEYTALSTFSGTGSSSKMEIWAVKTDKYGVRTETQIRDLTGLATATAKTESFTDGLSLAGSELGYGLVVKLENAVAMTVMSLTTSGAVVNALEC